MFSECAPTVKLYDERPYDTAFTAKVLSANALPSGRWEVVLDRTLFFPEEGGQSPDEGTLGGAVVSDVQLRGEVIVHTVNLPLEVGTEVSGEIDWTHRFSNMQQHSGEHIFSGTVHTKFGYNNVGFHLSDQTVTMDFDGALSFEQALEVETEVNRVICGDSKIEARYVSKEELATFSYRSKKELAGPVRLVTVYGADGGIVDICACCAPHVARTGEIGLLKIVGFQNYKGGVRISILCGFRALMDYRDKCSLLSEIGALVSGNQDNMVDQVRRLNDQVGELKYKLSAMARTQALQQVNAVLAEETNPLLFFDGLDTDTLRNAVNLLMEKHSGVCGAFSGNDENGYSFVLGSNSVDLRDVAKKLREELGAKGGGKPNMIQGSIPSTAEAIRVVMNDILR